ncbi:TATA box-binding protein-associated factor RNA polymerase I subunit A isoform X1 [Gallus gallus]|uniref:TATA box-binding protein-associated factor RNA polymerase I subunit A isoform X1 n=1 Tax=Gallus gallus TaxID=9031 RepID=UPI001F016686|nr:TATA box-binding protein-associated factor RNA polymerase I subunit A isoform X1 [Gallus gallus]
MDGVRAGSALQPALHLPFLPRHFYRACKCAAGAPHGRPASLTEASGGSRRGRCAVPAPCFQSLSPLQKIASSNEHRLNFWKSKELCLNYIQDALLQKQWKRAAEFLTSYIESLEKDFSTQYMGPSEMIWRIGTEILCNHSRSNIREFNSFIEQMKTLGVKRYLKVCLEHAFHLLCNGLVDEAYQNLSLAESWRFGEQTVVQDKEMKLIQAYRGLLDYYSWSNQKNILLKYGKEGFEDLSVEQEMHGCFRKAAVNLKEIIKIPGVWDLFVKSYVDLLEFYGDHQEAREVLTDYAYNSKFPANPNAHVYLYQFLKRHGAPKKSLISALKILHDIVPSHELMIDFNTMLQKSKKRKRRRLGLEVIFAVLDYAGWKKNVRAWSCLARQVKQIVISEKHLDWIKQEWNSRKDWWPAFHFSRYLAKRDWQENESLSYEKALLAGVLLGKDCKYFKYVSHQGCKAQVKKFRTLKKFVNKHSTAYLSISGL